MDRLGGFAEQTEKFLRSLASDLGLESKKGLWLAKNFKNESVGFDAEFAGAVSDAIALKGSRALETIIGPNAVQAIEQNISYSTLAEYSKIGEALEPAEFFTAAVYTPEDTEAPAERRITYKQLAEIRALLSSPFLTEGTIQGVLHALHPGATEPFFTIRMLQNGKLARCEYAPEMYHEIYEAIEDDKAVLLVTGEIHWDRATDAVIKVIVTKPPIANARISPAEFDSIFGSAPTFTGTMTTDEYLDWIRGDGE